MSYVDDAGGHLEPPQEVLATCGPLITTMATGMTGMTTRPCLHNAAFVHLVPYPVRFSPATNIGGEYSSSDRGQIRP